MLIWFQYPAALLGILSIFAPILIPIWVVIVGVKLVLNPEKPLILAMAVLFFGLALGVVIAGAIYIGFTAAW